MIIFLPVMGLVVEGIGVMAFVLIETTVALSGAGVCKPVLVTQMLLKIVSGSFSRTS